MACLPGWSRFCSQHPEGILEIPIPTLRKNSKNIGSGGYFRLYPYVISDESIRRYVCEEKKPYNFYSHPWETNPKQPKVKGVLFKSKLRHCLHLNK
jgi:hypothetical protein